MSVWRVQGLEKRFSSWQGLSRVEHVVLKGVDLTVERGERVGLIGESGSGKTTLARTALGLHRPDAGRVELFGEDTSGWSTRRWRQARHRVQLLFQNPRAMLHPTWTLRTLLRESSRLHRPDADPVEAVERVLGEVGLQGRASAVVDQLSGGEQRRAGIARLLLARPELVVADEPTAGLDAHLKASLVELLLARLGPEASLVLVSHDLALVLWACHRVVVLHQGVVVERFASDEVHRVDHHPHTRSLLQAAGLQQAARAGE